MSKKLSSLSAVFPAYNDGFSIPEIIKKMQTLLPKVANKYEIIVVNDASTDQTKEVLFKLKKNIPYLTVIQHEKNQGYGATLIDGFLKAKYEYIFYTDGDGQYDVNELLLLIQSLDETDDMVTGYKLQREDNLLRKGVGAFYNQSVKLVFGLKTKDTDCDFRLFKKSLITDMNFTIKSGGFDVQFLNNLSRQKAKIKEVGVHHYERQYGSSQFFTPGRVIKSIRDIILLRLSLSFNAK